MNDHIDKECDLIVSECNAASVIASELAECSMRLHSEQDLNDRKEQGP